RGSCTAQGARSAAFRDVLTEHLSAGQVMKFNEFRNGQVIQAGPIVIEEQEMLAFAKQYDPQWFHTDPDRASQGRWGGLIGSGWLTCSLAMRMVVDSVLTGSESFGSPGVDRIRWMLP